MHSSILVPFRFKPTNLELRKIAFNSSHPSTSQQSTSENEDELVKVKQVLYLLNKFAVSDQCYHEVSMLYQEMPQINREHLVHSLEYIGLSPKACSSED